MSAWIELEALATLRGEVYVDARRRWLPAMAPDRLAALCVANDWRTAVTARILLAHLRWGREYGELMTLLDGEDPKAASRHVARYEIIYGKYRALAVTWYGEEILPWCWEALLKHADAWPRWKLVTALQMLAVVPRPESAEPVLWCALHAVDDVLAQAAARVLARLPRERIDAAVATETARAGRLRTRLALVMAETAEERIRPV